MSMERMAGGVALVTGAGRGIGAAVADALALRGLAVAVTDADGDAAADVADRLSQAGHRAVAHRLDVTDAAAVERVVAAVEDGVGPIEVLVNVAGILRTGSVSEFGDADWAEVFAVNTTGVFHLCRAVSRRMRPRRSGTIITVGSNAAGVPRIGMAAYAASKAAATMFTKCLGLELARYGIRCNVVSPGSTDTPMQRSLWADGSGAPEVVAGRPEDFRVGIPLGRLAEPSDVAEAVAFLASPQARHITMHDLYVDGGATLRA
jgi:2,3-dihydro-2,3-dihydroxybenzoate dehydrogenase